MNPEVSNPHVLSSAGRAAELLHMGEYSAHVWTCFGLLALLLVWDLLLPALRLRRLKREITQRALRQSARAAESESPL